MEINTVRNACEDYNSSFVQHNFNCINCIIDISNKNVKTEPKLNKEELNNK